MKFARGEERNLVPKEWARTDENKARKSVEISCWCESIENRENYDETGMAKVLRFTRNTRKKGPHELGWWQGSNR